MSVSTISFSHGVASGDPYQNSVILWTRITPPQEFSGLVDVRWEVSTSAAFEPGSITDSGVFSTSGDRDWTVKVEADGLTADTTYHYRFSVGEVQSQVGQTKTLPVGNDPVRLAVFSCANFTAAEQFAAYGRAAEIHGVNPYDALLHLGDYIYEYGPGGYGSAEDAAPDRGFLPDREIINLDDYRQRYAQYHTDLNLQSLRAAAPLIAGWDDHETANNSWSGGAQNHQSETEGDWIARRDAALQAYYEWLPIREPGQRQASDGATALSPLTQAYRSFNFGDVLSLHMLETRLTARDEQLAYPAPAAVQARIGAILADPAQVAAYAAQLGLTPPTGPAAIPAFAAALAPAVTQELVLATVQQAWGDPNRDMIGDSQLAWLQQQLATSPAAWQVLGQQTLMQSMAVPAELLLNAGDPALLDKYAAPLQKLATGTAFADLTPQEQALFAEATKIPYNLDAWDGYGVERETILQSALALGKRLISLAGDTHNAWAGVLDTMGPGTQPAGTVAGVEFGAPGVTSPGLERVLAGADAYIRAFYPAVDGLDGLFMGYVNGITYADTNRRGFLDLTVSKEEAIGSYQFLDGVNPQSGQTQWASETVVAASDLSLSLEPEATPEISWQPGWSELDLVFGLATDTAGGQTLLDPVDYATLPRAGVQLADVTVLGSEAGERIYAGVGSLVDGAGGGDELFNTDSQGSNLLVGSRGADSFFLRPVNDRIIGNQLFSGAATFGLPLFTALVDRERDSFLIDSSDPGSSGRLQILDFEAGIDNLLLDGQALQGEWAAVREQLQAVNVEINAAPQLTNGPIAISLKGGTETSQDLSQFGLDLDGDNLQLLKLQGPEWISTSGTLLKINTPAGLSPAELAEANLILGFSDGKAVIPFHAELTLEDQPIRLSLSNTIPSLAENFNTASRIRIADITITPASETNTIFLAGADAESFEVDGTSLFLKAGTSLNFEAKRAYNITVAAPDPSLPGSTAASADFSLAITDINEPPSTRGISNVSVVENSADIVIDLFSSFEDPESPASALAYTLTGNSNSGLISTSLDPATGALRLSFPKQQTGTAQITVQAQDSGAQSVSTSFAVSVLPFDANKDGIADSDQKNVISITTPNQTFITFVADGQSPTPLIGSIPNPDPLGQPANIQFEQGFYSVNYEDLAPGDRTTLALYLPSGSNVNSYWKYGASSQGAANQWYDFRFDPLTGTGAKFEDLNGDGQNEVILHFADGLRGDNDLLSNGSIADPGAPALDPALIPDKTPPDTNQPIPGQPNPGPGDGKDLARIRATVKRDVLTGTADQNIFIFEEIQSASRKNQPIADVITNFGKRDRLSFKRFNEQPMANPDGRKIGDIQGIADDLSFEAVNLALGNRFKGKAIGALEINGFDGTFVAVNGGRNKVPGGRSGFDRLDQLIHLEEFDLASQGPIRLV